MELLLKKDRIFDQTVKGQLIKMAAIPIYGINIKKIFYSKTKKALGLNLDI